MIIRPRLMRRRGQTSGHAAVRSSDMVYSVLGGKGRANDMTNHHRSALPDVDIYSVPTISRSSEYFRSNRSLTGKRFIKAEKDLSKSDTGPARTTAGSRDSLCVLNLIRKWASADNIRYETSL